MGSIVRYRVGRDNELYAELCTPRGRSIVSHYHYILGKLVGGGVVADSTRMGEAVAIKITRNSTKFSLIYQKHAGTSQCNRAEVEN